MSDLGKLLGFGAFAALVASCVGVIVLWFRVVRRAALRSAVVWTWFMAALLAAFAGARIHQARSVIGAVATRTFDDSLGERPWIVPEHLSRILVTQLVVSAALATAMLTLLVAACWGRPKLSQRWLAGLGEDQPSTDDETRSTYRELAIEFCLEASCYWAPEIRVVNDAQTSAEERKIIAEDVLERRARRADEIAAMARLGIPKCRLLVRR